MRELVGTGASASAGALLSACDRVRDGALVDLGVRLEDKPDGSSVWKPEDPAVLRQASASSYFPKKQKKGVLLGLGFVVGTRQLCVEAGGPGGAAAGGYWTIYMIR